jgi:hypothetical protein
MLVAVGRPPWTATWMHIAVEQVSGQRGVHGTGAAAALRTARSWASSASCTSGHISANSSYPRTRARFRRASAPACTSARMIVASETPGLTMMPFSVRAVRYLANDARLVKCARDQSCPSGAFPSERSLRRDVASLCGAMPPRLSLQPRDRRSGGGRRTRQWRPSARESVRLPRRRPSRSRGGCCRARTGPAGRRW